MTSMVLGRTEVAGIDLEILRDANAVADAAAERIVSQVNRRPDLVMCLPTGRTPRLTYRKLVEAYRAGRVSFADARILNVDEYVGLSAGDEGSFADYMEEHLLRHIDIRHENTHIPNGKADDPEAEARRYNELIASLGGIDFMLLGVGANGHLGFNEPGSSPDCSTHVAFLAAETIATNRPDLPLEFPAQTAITIGLRTILDAREVLLLASGSGKAEALRQLFEGGPVDRWPVAVLRRHRNAGAVCDIEAASLLQAPDADS